MAKKYRLESVTLGAAWDALVEKSNDSTVFSTSTYLQATGLRLGLYHCYNGDELRGGVAVVESPNGESAIMDDLVIYGGIFYGPPTTGQGQAQVGSERFDLAVFAADALAQKYQNISFNLAPSISDIRPFLWHNYSQGQRQYAIDVRYTSYLGIADFKDANSLEDIVAYGNASVARRQQIRYARRDGIKTESSDNVSQFIDFYRLTMERQDNSVANERLDQMEVLVSSLLKRNLAKMFVSRTKDNIAGSYAVYALDSKRAYYLFGANDPALRDSPSGTAVLWDAFYPLAGDGVAQVDLEGVNSPKRGWFKLSFGGELLPYYQASLAGT
jgi:hypothetical protein